MQRFKKKIWSKYALYFLCFMALNGIEFLRSTATGDVWKTAANCTGFVIMVIIFSQLPVRRFFKPINYIYTMLCIAAIGAVCLHWRQHVGDYSLGQMVTAVMNIWWLGMVVPYFVRQAIKEKTLKLKTGALGWTWIILTVWTMISVAGRWWPVWYLFMFGSFYLVRFKREDRDAFLDAMIDGTIVSFFVIQGYAYLFRPYDIVRYQGAFSNSNMMALYYLIVYCMVLFKLHLLHVKKAKWGWKLFYFIGAGGLLGFQFLTICRTSWVCSVFVTICYGWMAVHRAWGEKAGKVLLRGGVLALCAALTFPAVFWTVRWLPTIHPHPVWHDGEWNPDRVHSWDPADSEKYVEIDEFLEAALGRIVSVLDVFHSRNPLVLHVYAGNEWEHIPDPDYDWSNNSLEIRKIIYKTYWNDSTWFGNPNGSGYYIFEESGVQIWHGQNLWIQIIYDFGYPAGVLVTVLIVLAGWKVLKKAKMVRQDIYSLIPIIIFIVYIGYGITEIVWNPGQLVFSLMFIVMHPQLTEKCNSSDKAGNCYGEAL